MSLLRRSPKLDHSLKLSVYTAKENGHWKRKCPEYLVDKKDGKVNKGIFDIQVLMCALLVFIVAPGYLILVRLLKISNSKQELQNKQRLVEGKVTMSVGSSSKIDMIIIAHSLYFRD